MAKNDPIVGLIDALLLDEVDYKSNLTSDLFLKIAQNLNFKCSALEGLKCDFLPFGTTSWTSPDNVLSAFAIGISGSGGGGGTAPAVSGGGISPTQIYQGSGGGDGGDTLFNGQVVAEGGFGGQPFRFRLQNIDGNSTTSGEVSGLPINPNCPDTDFIKGAGVPQGGRGAYQNSFFTVDGRDFSVGGALGGESGRLGFMPLNLTPATTYPVVIGAGGVAGANDPNTTAHANATGQTIFNAEFGSNSPGMAIICLGF